MHLRSAVRGVLVAVLLSSAWGVAASAANDATSTFTIERITPSPSLEEVEIVFSEDVSLGDVRSGMRLRPPVELHWWNTEMSGQRTLKLRGEFRPGETYFVSIPEKTKNVNRKTYNPTVTTFTTPDRVPRIAFTDTRAAIERDSRQMLHVDLMNVNEMRVEAVGIPPILAREASLIPKPATGESVYDYQKLLRERMDGIAKVVQAEPAFAPFLGEVALDSSVFFKPEEKNTQRRFSLPLNFRSRAEEGQIVQLRVLDNRPGRIVGSPLRMMNVSDLAVSYKISHEDLLIWTTSLHTGEPVSEAAVLIFDASRHAFAAGATDRDGLLLVKKDTALPCLEFNKNGKPPQSKSARAIDLRLAHSLVAVSDVDAASITLSKKVSLDDNNANRQRDESGLAFQDIRGVIFTERGAYRPGETVHLKATIRQYDNGNIIIPAGQKFAVSIRNSRGEEMFTKGDMTLSDYGTWHVDLPLKTYASLGTYTAEISVNRKLLPGDDKKRDFAVARTTFQVQEFTPPRHRVEVRFARDEEQSQGIVNIDAIEQTLACTIEAKYYAGGPVKNGQVRWTVYGVPTEYRVPDYENYTFGNPQDLQQGEDENSGNLFLETGESMLDENGAVTVRLPLAEEILSGMHGLKIVATVLDFDGRAAIGVGTFQEKPRYFVGLGYHPDSVMADAPQVLGIVVVDAKGRRVRGGTVQISILQRGYYYYRERNDEGNAYWRWDDVWRDHSTASVALSGGQGDLNFAFQQGGRFLVRATYRDADGKDWSSGTLYYVDGPDYWGWQDPDRVVYQRVQLLPDRGEYAVGDKMRLLVRGERLPEELLLTIERDRILEYRIVKLRKGEIQIPITEDMKPNARIAVLAELPREGFPTYFGEYDNGAPSFLFGNITIKVRNDVATLKVAIGGKEDRLRALPGEKATIALFVTDSKGIGVSAELAVAVVDEQVLALTRYRTPSLAPILEFLLPFNVWTGDMRALLQPQTPFGMYRNNPLTGGDGAYEPDHAALETTLRKNFDPVAFFDAAVRADANGRATVSFTYPDTMTTYRVFAIACDTGGRFASAEKPALVRKDFYLEPGMPAFLNVGDTFRFQVSAFNKLEATGAVALDIESASPLTLTTSAEAQTLAANDRALISVDGKAERPGIARVIVAGHFADKQDAVQKDIPVHSGSIIERDVRFGTLTKTGAISYTFPESVLSQDWESFPASDASVVVMLSRSPFLKLVAGLRYLIGYPYGCVEQTSSRTSALASLAAVLKSHPLPNIDPADVDRYLRAGVDRLLSMQLESGGFGYWPGDRIVNDWGTTYALDALLLAKDAGAAVPDDRLFKGLEYLRAYLDPNQARQLQESRGVGFLGACGFLLARGGRMGEAEYRTLTSRFNDLGREGKLLALWSGALSGQEKPEALKDRLRAVLKETRTAEEWMSFHAVSREPSVALMACKAILGDDPETDREAGLLLSEMKTDGCWTSTSDTGWALRALGSYFQGVPLEDENVTGEVIQDGQVVSRFTITKDISQEIVLDPRAFRQNPRAEIKLNRAYPLLYSLSVAYPRSDYAKSGHASGFQIGKRIENTAGTGEIRVGDVLKVSITFEPAGYNFQHIVLDDPLPAGCVAINTALATEQPPAHKPDRQSDYWWDYWDRALNAYLFKPNHFEIRDDRVLAFRESLWRGTYVYSYYARAVCAGTFRVPPTKVQLMYRPETCAYTAESTMIIEERP